MAAAHLGRLLVLVACLGAATTARAEFHLWVISELFSNSDGSVQFIELSATAGGQQFLAQHTITSSQGATTHTYTFPGNLPGDTLNKRFLIGTQGFAALNLVAPDYVVPNGFLFTTNGSVNFAGFDTVSYAALPTDGTSSYNRGATIAASSPTNFAGSGASLAVADYSGAWASPTESGWGLSLIRGGSGAYGAIMYHYDTDTRPTWYWMSGGSFTGNVYSVPVSLYAGPAYDASPFDPARVSSRVVGSASISFASPTSATINYTINGKTVSKVINRLEY